MLVHIVDDERIYSYRALCFARGEKQSLPGFEQDDYAQMSKAKKRDLDNIFDEYEAVRRSTICLFNGLPEESLTRMRTGSSSYHAATVRASCLSHRRTRTAAYQYHQRKIFTK